MATTAATRAAKSEISALRAAEEKIDKDQGKAKVYRSRSEPAESFVRITIFASKGNGNYARGGKNNTIGSWVKAQLDSWLTNRYLADYVMTETSISEEDFKIAFEGV